MLLAAISLAEGSCDGSTTSETGVLKRLDLSENALHGHQLLQQPQQVTAASFPPSLEILDLSFNPLHDPGMIWLAQTLTAPLDPSQVGSLSRVRSTLPLRSVRVREVTCTPIGMVAFAQKLLATSDLTLRQLDLRGHTSGAIPDPLLVTALEGAGVECCV